MNCISNHDKCLIALTSKQVKKSLKLAKKVNKTHNIGDAKKLIKLLKECVGFAEIDLKILEK